MSNDTLQIDKDTGEVHYRCGGTLRRELQPRSLHLRLRGSHSIVHRTTWIDTPEVMSRCDKCGLVGIPIEPANAQT